MKFKVLGKIYDAAVEPIVFFKRLIVSEKEEDNPGHWEAD